MKNKFSVIIAVIIIITLSSCGSSNSRTKPTNNNDYESIIGKSIIIGNFEVAQYDFPWNMNWDDAKRACASLGNGWRLPSKEELNMLYHYRDLIKNFRGLNYWSSTEYDYHYEAWYINFLNGQQKHFNKYPTNSVRAIKAL